MMKSIIRPQIIIIFISLLLNSYGCAIQPRPQCIDNGKQYGKQEGIFTGQWYDYYECALSYKKGGCYQYALNDLNKAINIEFKDERWTKTYGMHFMDYFPHREKGIVLYLMKKNSLAQKELELSIQQEPSAKAQFYLNKVRIALIKNENKALTKPQINIFSSYHKSSNTNTKDNIEFKTNEHPVVIHGMVFDDQYVSSINILQKPVLIEESKKKIHFHKEFKLSQGHHQINITALNLMGGKSIKKITVHVDRSGPIIAIENYKPQKIVSGFLYDVSKPMALFIDGKPVHLNRGPQCHFSHHLDLKSRFIKFDAYDQLGNKTEMTIHLKTFESMKSQSVFLAQSKLLHLSDSQPLQSIKKGLNSNDINIQLNELKDFEIIYKSEINIMGLLKSKKNLKKIEISISENMSDSTKILYHTNFEKGVKRIIFNPSVMLNVGENIINITVNDISGFSKTKQLKIIHKIPDVLSLKNRCALAYHSFNNVGLIQKWFEIFQNAFLKALTDWQRFQILQRDKPYSVVAFENNNQLHPFLLFTGMINGDDNYIEITAKLTDIQTSKELCVKDIYDEFEHYSKDLLNIKARELIRKIQVSFPLIKSKLKRKNNDRLQFKLNNQRIPLNWPIIIFKTKVHDSIRGSNSEILWNTYIEEVFDNGYCDIKSHKNSVFNEKAEWMVNQ